MKRVFFLLTIVLLLNSCAGSVQQKIIHVREYKFSVQTPPSSWKQVDMKKEGEKINEQLLRGGRFPPGMVASVNKKMSDELARKFEGLYTCTWKKGDDAAIAIVAKKHTEQSKQKAYKDILYTQIENRLDSLLIVFREAVETIDVENEGIFEEGVKFASIEATIKCFNDAGKLKHTEKMISYILDTDSHFYRFLFTTEPGKFEKYNIVFEEVLNSFSYMKE